MVMQCVSMFDMVKEQLAKKKNVIGFDELNEKLDRVIDAMATKDDIAKIWDSMATKDDIAKIWDSMATKDDIAKIWDSMATKDDIANMATKDDIALVVDNMATKDDLMDGLIGVETRLNRKIDDVDEKHTKKFQEILTAVDGFASRFERVEMESVNVHHRLDRHEEWAQIFASKSGVTLQH